MGPPIYVIVAVEASSVILNLFFVAAYFSRFQNLAAHIEKDKFKNYLLNYNTLRKIVMIIILNMRNKILCTTKMTMRLLKD